MICWYNSGVILLPADWACAPAASARVSTNQAIRIGPPHFTAGPMVLARREQWQRSLPFMRLCLAHLQFRSYPYAVFRPRSSGAFMAIVHPHNLRNPEAGIQRPYGVRITLMAGDPF